MANDWTDRDALRVIADLMDAEVAEEPAVVPWHEWLKTHPNHHAAASETMMEYLLQIGTPQDAIQQRINDLSAQARQRLEADPLLMAAGLLRSAHALTVRAGEVLDETWESECLLRCDIIRARLRILIENIEELEKIERDRKKFLEFLDSPDNDNPEQEANQ